MQHAFPGAHAYNAARKCGEQDAVDTHPLGAVRWADMLAAVQSHR